VNLRESRIGPRAQFLNEELSCRIEVYVFVDPLPFAVPGLPREFPVTGTQWPSLEHLCSPELNDRIEPVPSTLAGILLCGIGLPFAIFVGTRP
jgi:hypothetical protein